MNKGVLSSLICGFILGGGVVNMLRIATDCNSVAGLGLSMALFAGSIVYFAMTMLGVFDE